MSSGEDLEPLSESLTDVFTRLGLPDPVLNSKLSEEWEALAGSPWSGRSRPLYIRAGTLYVEASSPSTVAFLRYAVTALLETMQTRFGPGVVEAVEVVPPPRR